MDGNIGPSERLPQVRTIVLGGTQENANAIERHAVTCERDHAPNDLDAFATFAGRGEHLDLAVRLRLWRLVAFIEEIALKPRESARLDTGRHIVQIFDLEAQAIA
jgi:hypothetical protein